MKITERHYDGTGTPFPSVARPVLECGRRARGAACLIPWMLLSSLSVASLGRGDTFVGSDDSDNNSFTFPFWRGQLNGTIRDDAMFGLRGDDLVYGQQGDDTLIGNAGHDQLYGEAGNDDLRGGVDGRDTLWGGAGDDIYFVGDSLDSVREYAGQGVDTVVSFVDFTLPDNVENLFLKPVAEVGGDYDPWIRFDTNCVSYSGPLPCHQLGSVASGNGLNNEIRGNLMKNRLYGLGGNDILFGREGNDALSGGAGNDFLAGFSFDRQWWTHEIDTLSGGTGADVFVIGLSGRPGGLPVPDDMYTSEDFPQYLGQGEVYILDFQWREGDKIEVFGDIADYWVELESDIDLGAYAKVLWNGTAYGYSARELVAYVVGITRPHQLVPAYDFR